MQYKLCDNVIFIKILNTKGQDHPVGCITINDVMIITFFLHGILLFGSSTIEKVAVEKFNKYLLRMKGSRVPLDPRTFQDGHYTWVWTQYRCTHNASCNLSLLKFSTSKRNYYKERPGHLVL